MHIANPVIVPKKTRRLFSKIIIPAALGLTLFSAGWMFGSGRISLNRLPINVANTKLPSRLDYSSVDTIYKSLKENFDGELDETTLIDGLKAGLVKAAGDPYTDYFSSDEAKDFYGQLDGTFEGIGAELGKDDDKNIIIISPLAGYPAEKAGLKPKDIIAEVDGKSVYDLSISDAVTKIRGAAGSEVKLTIVRDGKPRVITITREQISIPSVKSEVKDSVGVLSISRFGDDTVALAAQAATSFKAAGVKGVVLDLRSNPGGLLEAAVGVASLWLKEKTILTERRDGVIIQTHKSEGTATLLGMPTVVLINEGSASASEITAGALRDNNAATLIGEKSFGKGSVQQPIDLKGGGLLKVTIARWYTPNGKNIDKDGITPDTVVKISDKDIESGKDSQLKAALDSLK